MKEKLKDYLLENDETLKDIVSEINSYNGDLDYLDYQENDDDFFEIYFNNKSDVARAICYGNYNYSDDYVIFDAYGNLESCDEYEYIRILQDNINEIIDELIDNYRYLRICDDEIDTIIEESEVNE